MKSLAWRVDSVSQLTVVSEVSGGMMPGKLGLVTLRLHPLFQGLVNFPRLVDKKKSPAVSGGAFLSINY